jgi:hypothetical protein
VPLIALALLPVALAGRDCPEPRTVGEFLHHAQVGEGAFASMDLPGLLRAQEQALFILPCLGERVTPQDAAAFHRMMAMAAFTEGDEQQVLAEFHAARRLQPGYEMPASVAPKGHPLLELYERSIDADEGEMQSTRPPEGGFVTVDGVRGAPRPQGISVVVQVFGPGDDLEETLFLRPNQPLPAFGPDPVAQAAARRRHIALISASGALTVASGVLYGMALQSREDFYTYRDGLPDDELRSRAVQTNGLTLAWSGAGAAALGLGVAAVVTW